MGKVEDTIKSEIVRLSKKEINAVFRPMASEVRALKAKLTNLIKNVSFLDRFLKDQIRKDEQKKQTLEVTEKEVKASRFTPERIHRLRLKLGLSQRELAVLTGVTLGAVGSWEKGKFEPRGKKKAKLLALRKLGKRDIKKILEKQDPKEKKKPGRRKSTNGRKKAKKRGRPPKKGKGAKKTRRS